MAKRKSKTSKREKKVFNLIDQYRQAFVYLRESKKYIGNTVLAFFAIAIVAFFIPIPEFFLDFIRRIFQDIIEQTEGLGFFGLWRFIFLNNVGVAFMSIFLGFFYGFFPIFSLIFNASAIGIVSGIVTDAVGIQELWRLIPHGVFELTAIFISLGIGIRSFFSLFGDNADDNASVFLFALVGGFVFLIFFTAGALIDSLLFSSLELVLEVTALFGIVGVFVGLYSGSKALKKEARKRFSYNFDNSLRVFLLIVVPLLFLAAAIEAALIAFF